MEIETFEIKTSKKEAVENKSNKEEVFYDRDAERGVEVLSQIEEAKKVDAEAAKNKIQEIRARLNEVDQEVVRIISGAKKFEYTNPEIKNTEEEIKNQRLKMENRNFKRKNKEK